MPHEDSHRHRARRPRTVEHRLAGGHHRNQQDGCAWVALAIFAVPATTVILAVALAASYLTT